ncbi:MAG: hypothetical protein DSY70_05280 [Desulfobulbus sp.]|nr:MAG: hypothetical protein DSY70_05280 [Desulfobulbus sp.]
MTKGLLKNKCYKIAPFFVHIQGAKIVTYSCYAPIFATQKMDKKTSKIETLIFAQTLSTTCTILYNRNES